MSHAPSDPSRWRDRIALAALASAGLLVSGYLAAYQLGAVAAPWDPVFGPASSARVLHSVVSRLLPVPDAAAGAAAYAVELALDLVGGAERWRTHPWLVLAFSAVAVALGVAGVALTAVQVLVVRAGCTLCLCSAALSIAIAWAVVAGDELRAALKTVSAGAGERGHARWR
ncbi:vitamin K epoxide reductase family protein [Anaeromyxobacter diazotrophicus]|uniref:Vitamin K epoxide reductase domain-containing protein n=1 Tax=Anaeromyxobacter diazotrophicus TaxID=2590199 RepID=A0A7I9VNF9_9BACT|nr:vitamin K epoxide reductase family protein [Anaeromyxobacter diazotrophicus]GEJ57931.1 hypothetical protein AMYX_26720 [Anaeromyxobacter diazotrophicus]